MPLLETLIYAELLSNIRQISIIAVLPTSSNNKTSATLSSDGQQIILQHEATTTRLKLPGQVDSNSQLQAPALGKTELSWRLPLASNQPSRPNSQDAETPWPAKSLDGTEVSCRECKSSLVKKGSVKIWKDLPSENWAEMMEFWHCHKPDDEPSGHEGHDHSHSKDPNADKGYGANSKFAATSGVGFVDLTTFLLAESDCQNFESTPPSDPTSKHLPLSCLICHTYIGHIDPISFGIRLYKWRLHLSNASKSTPTTIPAIQIYTTQLSSIIQAQVTSRLILVPLSPPPPLPPTSPTSPIQSKKKSFLSLWILSPSIHFSSTISTSTSSIECQSAMKVFYQEPGEEEAEALMGKEGVEEVFLPWEAINEIESALRESGKCLPASGRRFREWNVGLLERFGG